MTLLRRALLLLATAFAGRYIHFVTPTHGCAGFRPPPPATFRRRRTMMSASNASPDEDDHSPPAAYVGPALPPDAEVISGVSLSELSLDLAVGSSSSAPGGLGLYVRLSDPSEVERVTVPALTLLCGYSRVGTFEPSDAGDKTVGFALTDPNTAVFYERRLVSIADALRMAASEVGGGACGLIGHELRIADAVGGDDDDSDAPVHIEVESVEDGFPRYFVPELINRGEAGTEEDYSIQNFGQFCNDLAWDYSNPPATEREYDVRSDASNAVQLVWRVEFDEEGRCLRPSWPVSVFQRDATFDNPEFMELGTRYGWKYWQATVDLDKV